MTQEANPLQFAGAEASPQPSSPAQPAESGAQGGQAQTVAEQPQYLTPDAARKLFDEMFNSKGQSIAAKTENRIRKVLEAAQQQGVTLTPAQAQALVDTADAERSAPSQPQQVQVQGQAQPQAQATPQQATAQTSQAAAEAVHPVIAVATQMMEQAGVTLNDDDPENSFVDQTTTNPAVFLASIQAAIEAKARRRAAAGSPYPWFLSKCVICEQEASIALAAGSTAKNWHEFPQFGKFALVWVPH